MARVQLPQTERARDADLPAQSSAPSGRWILPYVGLARGYTALGDKQKAIASWEIALKRVPPAQEANRARFEQALRARKA
jgi:hypothetical protein